MAEKIMEQLSALADNECSASEARWATAQLLRNGDLKERWQRYHLISDVIKGHTPAVYDGGFADRVMAVIERESAEQGPTATRQGELWRTWRQPLIGFGLAASIAMLGIINMGLLGASDDRLVTDTTTSNLSGGDQQADALDEQGVVNRPYIDERLTPYLVNHSAYASRSAISGVLTHVRVAGYRAQTP